MSVAIPAVIADVDAAWLTEALRAAGVIGAGTTVSEADVVDISQGTGVFGDVLRVGLTYQGPREGAPDSVIVKIPTTAPVNLQVGLALGLYEREVNFFRQVAPSLKVRVPHCYWADMDLATNRFVLVIENLTDLVVGDQIGGCTLHQAEVAIDNLAALHATWWERPELREWSWLPTVDHPAYMATVPEIFRNGFPKLAELWGDRLPAEALELGHRLMPVFDEITIRCGQGPETLIHTDARLENLFFDPKGGDGFALIDFQLVLRGRGVGDIAYLLGTSMEVPDQRKHAFGLLRRYHDALVANGVTGYAFADCEKHFLEYVLYYLCSPVSLVASFDTANERGAALTDKFVERFFHLAADVRAGEVL